MKKIEALNEETPRLKATNSVLSGTNEPVRLGALTSNASGASPSPLSC